ncbi:MAG: PulJ/GspJ family protein [Gemmatimonadales bacterium]
MTRRRGFTLLELMVALVVGGLTLAGASAILGNLYESAAHLQAEVARMDRLANGERLIREVAASFQPGNGHNSTFFGTPRAAHFSSWCLVSDGWFERCVVDLTPRSDGLYLSLRYDNESLFSEVRLEMPQRELRYLADAADGGRWLAEWAAGTSAPLAIGVVSVTDTMVVRLGVWQ